MSPTIQPPPLNRTTAALAVFSFLVLGMAAQTWRVVSLERELATSQLAPAKVATVAAAARVETVTVQLAAAEKLVTRTLALVRVDTLMLAPQTAQDTATALVQLPVLAATHDSLQRACSAFVVSCEAYRSAAEKRFAADSTYRDRLERAIKAQQPRRFAAMWNRVKVPLVFVGGAYIGSRVTR